MKKPKPCQQCLDRTAGKSNDDGFEMLHPELREIGFERVECYQYDRVDRCKLCGRAWLRQYWEFDTEETQFEEWGERNWFQCQLSDDDLREIEAAVAAGTPLAHARFRPKAA